jgi:hypothetical protein
MRSVPAAPPKPTRIGLLSVSLAEADLVDAPHRRLLASAGATRTLAELRHERRIGGGPIRAEHPAVRLLRTHSPPFHGGATP